METLPIVITILGVLVGLMAVGIVSVYLLRRSKLKREQPEVNKVNLMVQESPRRTRKSASRFSANNTWSGGQPRNDGAVTSLSSPISGKRGSSDRHGGMRYMSPQASVATARSLGSLMAQSDQEKMDALLAMRNLCESNGVGTQHQRAVRPPSRGVPIRLGASPPAAPSSRHTPRKQVSRRTKARGIFGGLDADEDDDLLIELDNAVPAPGTQGTGHDRDANREEGQSRPGSSVSKPQPWWSQSRAEAALKDSIASRPSSVVPPHSVPQRPREREREDRDPIAYGFGADSPLLGSSSSDESSDDGMAPRTLV